MDSPRKEGSWQKEQQSVKCQRQGECRRGTQRGKAMELKSRGALLVIARTLVFILREVGSHRMVLSTKGWNLT